MKKFLFLLVLFTTTACAQVLLDGVDGFSNKRIFLGLNGGGIEYDKDSSAYKIFYENKQGVLDSMWIVVSSRASTPWAVNLEAKQRADADGNLLAQIILKASIVSVDSLRSRMTSAESSLLLKASRLEVDGLRDSVWAEIVLKASIASVNSLANSLENAEAAIQLKANKVYVDSLGLVYVSLINLKANANSVDTLRGRMTNAEASILLKANQTYVEELGTSLSSQIALKANILVVDTLKNRMTTAEAGISANASAITGLDGDVSNVIASLLLYAKKDSVISYINISPGTIKISASKIELDGTAIADSLFGQVIIAPVIRTSASGAGVVLNGTTNRLEFLKTDGTVGSYLDANGGNIQFTGTITGSTSTTIETGDVWASNVYAQVLDIAEGSARTQVFPGIVRTGGYNGSTWVYDTLATRSELPTALADLTADATHRLTTDTEKGIWNSKQASLGLTSINAADFTWVGGDLRVNGNIANWNSAYSWGNHAAQNYIANPTNAYGLLTNDGFGNLGWGGSAYIQSWMENNFSETDPTVYAWAKASVKPTYTYSEVGAQAAGSYQAQLSGTGFVKISGTTISYDNSIYLTGNQTVTLGGILSGSGTTSITASAASGYYMPTTSDQSAWNAKQASLGLSSINATDFTWVGGDLRVNGNIANWNSAYSWGNHASQNYIVKPSPDAYGLLTNDGLGNIGWGGSAYIQSWMENNFSETDPTVYAWAKASVKPTYTYSEVGAASSTHNHNGVYEAYITRSTGFLKWSGSSWSWDGNSYALSSHNHDAAYHPLVSGGKTITYSVEDGNLDVWTSQYSNGVLISLKKNGVEQ